MSVGLRGSFIGLRSSALVGEKVFPTRDISPARDFFPAADFFFAAKKKQRQ